METYAYNVVLKWYLWTRDGKGARKGAFDIRLSLFSHRWPCEIHHPTQI